MSYYIHTTQGEFLMKKYTSDKIIKVQKNAMQTFRYRNALARHKVLEQQLLKILPMLPQEQQDIINDYCDSFFELHLYMLEAACEQVN